MQTDDIRYDNLSIELKLKFSFVCDRIPRLSYTVRNNLPDYMKKALGSIHRVLKIKFPFWRFHTGEWMMEITVMGMDDLKNVVKNIKEVIHETIYLFKPVRKNPF